MINMMHVCSFLCDYIEFIELIVRILQKSIFPMCSRVKAICVLYAKNQWMLQIIQVVVTACWSCFESQLLGLRHTTRGPIQYRLFYKQGTFSYRKKMKLLFTSWKLPYPPYNRFNLCCHPAFLTSTHWRLNIVNYNYLKHIFLIKILLNFVHRSPVDSLY